MPPRIYCTRTLAFDAAHRVVEHESKCKFLHGHRYQVEARFAAPALDPLGRVIDFGVIRERLGGWIEEHWDHNVILWERDRTLGDSLDAQTGQTTYYLPYNPTAENIALYLLETICPALFADEAVACVSVIVRETPNCSAEALHAG